MSTASNESHQASGKHSSFQPKGSRKKKPAGGMADPLQLPPQNLDAEVGVLGSILLMNEAIDEVGEVLKADHFYSDANQKIYAAIQHLYENNVRGIDYVTLIDELNRRDQFEDVGGANYSMEIDKI